MGKTFTWGIGAVLLVGLVACGDSDRKGVRYFGPGAPSSGDHTETRYLQHGNGTPRTNGPSLLDPSRRGHPHRVEAGTPENVPPPLPAALALVPTQDVSTALTSHDASFDPTKLCLQSNGILQPYSQIAVTNQACDPAQFPTSADFYLYATLKPNPSARPNVTHLERTFWLMFRGTPIGEVKETLTVVLVPGTGKRMTADYQIDSLCSGGYASQCTPKFDASHRLIGIDL